MHSAPRTSGSGGYPYHDSQVEAFPERMLLEDEHTEPDTLDHEGGIDFSAFYTQERALANKTVEDISSLQGLPNLRMTEPFRSYVRTAVIQILSKTGETYTPSLKNYVLYHALQGTAPHDLGFDKTNFMQIVSHIDACSSTDPPKNIIQQLSSAAPKILETSQAQHKKNPSLTQQVSALRKIRNPGHNVSQGRDKEASLEADQGAQAFLDLFHSSRYQQYQLLYTTLSSHAKYELALRFMLHDKGTAFDLQAAVKILKELGTSDAHYRLGEIYSEDRFGLTPDLEKSAEHYAQSRHPQALLHLGYMQMHGIGIQKNPLEAMRRFQASNTPLGKKLVAATLLLGEAGIPTQRHVATYFFESMNDPYAKGHLAFLAAAGIQCEQDDLKAAALLHESESSPAAEAAALLLEIHRLPTLSGEHAVRNADDPLLQKISNAIYDCNVDYPATLQFHIIQHALRKIPLDTDSIAHILSRATELAQNPQEETELLSSLSAQARLHRTLP